MRQMLATTLTLGLLGLPLGAAAEEVSVKMGQDALEPAEISISVGDTILFQNTEEIRGGQQVLADDGTFASPRLRKDETWPLTFKKSGVWHYHIVQHPDAKGTVTVK